jgi:hypothetical protein
VMDTERNAASSCVWERESARSGGSCRALCPGQPA